MITDPKGQWAHPGKNTRIPGNDITMKGVNYPVWAVPDVGTPMMMQPGQDYKFPRAQHVDEYPMQNREGYQDLELTDEEIAQYRDSGYVVEELDSMQEGGAAGAFSSIANAKTPEDLKRAKEEWDRSKYLRGQQGETNPFMKDYLAKAAIKSEEQETEARNNQWKSKEEHKEYLKWEKIQRSKRTPEEQARWEADNKRFNDGLKAIPGKVLREMSGYNAYQEIKKDPWGTAKAVGNTVLDGLMMLDPQSAVQDENPITGKEYWEDAGKAAKVLEVMPGLGLYGKAAKYGSKFGKAAGFGSKVGKGSNAIKRTKNVNGFPKYKNLPSKDFKSELDWGKFNKAIPNNPGLMAEYSMIEQSTKANGTWMKNPDGTEFKGSSPTKKELAQHGVNMTPEEAIQAQFIQQRSKNFKKSFGESKLINPDGSPTIQYHGSAKKFDSFDESKFQMGDSGYSGAGIYTAPGKTTAESYALSSGKFHEGTIDPTVYSLYGKGNNPITSKQLIDNSGGDVGFGKIGELKDKNLPVDLFNFHRKGAPVKDQLLPYDVAIKNQQRGISNIRKNEDAWELVFPSNKQLKSALGNDGKFDMSNPIIFENTALPDAPTPNIKLTTKKKSLDQTIGIMERVKADRLEAWKTKEGSRRLEKWFDGYFPKSKATRQEKADYMINNLEKVSFDNKVIKGYQENIKEINDLQVQTQAYEAEGMIDSKDVDEIMQEAESKKEIFQQGIYALTKRSHYSPHKNSVYIEPYGTEQEIGIAAAHEIGGHSPQSFRDTEGNIVLDKESYLDEKLRGIKIKDAETLKRTSPANSKDSRGDHVASAAYWDTGGKYKDANGDIQDIGMEKIPFANEVRQDMLIRGYIDNLFDPITKKLLKKHYADYNNDTRPSTLLYNRFHPGRAGSSIENKRDLRLYDIMDPKETRPNIKLLKSVMNDMLSIAPLTLGAGAAAAALGSEKATSEFQDGGTKQKGRQKTNDMSYNYFYDKLRNGGQALPTAQDGIYIDPQTGYPMSEQQTAVTYPNMFANSTSVNDARVVEQGGIPYGQTGLQQFLPPTAGVGKRASANNFGAEANNPYAGIGYAENEMQRYGQRMSDIQNPGSGYSMDDILNAQNAFRNSKANFDFLTEDMNGMEIERALAGELPSRQDGGYVEQMLTDQEIQDLRDQGYIVEEM